MRLSRLLSFDRIALDDPASDRKAVLEQISRMIGDAAHPPALVESALERREAGSSTALGDGVAIPHTRVEGLDRPRAAFLATRRGVDFHSPDGLPVDLFFALLVPAQSTSEHLAILAEIAECFSDSTMRDLLREARSPERIIAILRSSLTGAAA